MLPNPKLYEINTRVWIKQFGDNAKLNSVPFDMYYELADRGINIIWLMGIWKTCSSTIDKYCFEPDLTSVYNKTLSDWQKKDVIGSPFSIDVYNVNPALGNWDDICDLKRKLNGIGVKLLLDFVPNHFSADSTLIKTNPEIFLEADEEILSRDSYTFFKSDYNGKIFAHGRDPLFPPWKDTIQINHFNFDARIFLIETIKKLTEVCDGIRCDMAMLLLNNIFNNTWMGVLNKSGYEKPETEFWQTAISEVKKDSPDFIFLAEAYWDLEWQLQQLGFDFTYDKKLTDRLAADYLPGVFSHLNADKSYQFKSVRFIENHDEQRAIVKFGKQKSLAAATVISTIQGMKLYYDGQFEGKKIKLPMQLGREPVEKVSKTKEKYYRKLLDITKEKIFIEGEWSLLEPHPVSPGNQSFNNILAWQWKLNGDYRIILVNYSENTSQCRIKLDISITEENLILVDLLNDQEYVRKKEEITGIGMYIELKAYSSHIFSI